jgi:hypothetical protein
LSLEPDATRHVQGRVTKEPDEKRTWQDQDAAAEQAVDEMRRSLKRVHEQVRTYREVLQPEPGTQDQR